MAKAIGPNFLQEIKASGISGNGWAWGADGTLNISGLPPAVQAQIQAVYAAHDPATPFTLTSTDKDSKTVADYDGGLLLRAAVTYMVQQINAVRQDPTTVLPQITGAAARTAILAIYKGLL